MRPHHCNNSGVIQSDVTIDFNSKQKSMQKVFLNIIAACINAATWVCDEM